MTDLKDKSEEYQEGYKQEIKDIKEKLYKKLPNMKEKIIKETIKNFEAYYNFYYDDIGELS